MSNRFITAALTFALLVLIARLWGVGYRGLNAIDSLYPVCFGDRSCVRKGVQQAREEITYPNRDTRTEMQIVVTRDQREIDWLLVDRAKHSVRISDLLLWLQSRPRCEKECELFNALVEA